MLIRRSKTDQEGEGAHVAILRGTGLRPVAAVQEWLAASGITAGPLFRAVALGGKVGDAPLSTDGAARIIKRYARRVGLDPAAYAGHSLRAGYVTSAVEAGAPLLRITEVTRHRSLEMLQVYSRRVDMFRDHSGASFL